MSLVFGSLFLFILLSPGLLFRFSYLQGTYAKLTFKVSAVEEIFWALIPALFLQLIALAALETWGNATVRLDVIYQLITGSDQVDFAIIHSSMLPFLLYTAALLMASVLLGALARQVVRRNKLDQRIKFLRFGNEWHYLFSGEIFSLTKDIDPESIFMIQVDVVLDSSEGNIIYSGILEDYYLSKDNGLDRLYLINVYRRNLRDDLGQTLSGNSINQQHLDERYYAMPGDLFVVTYDKIINLNVTYIQIDQSTDISNRHERRA